MILTKQQRTALKRVFDRGPIPYDVDPDSPTLDSPGSDGRYSVDPTQARPTVLTYRQFRRTVVAPCYDTCIMIKWCGMYLGIESDGYTHS